jgi:DNA polymerase I-like protein with 3'-5' exonuclease and polymerase domains
MILKVDGKAIEWRVALDLSGDKVGIQEILDGVDQHEDNRKRFNLPSRLIAKTFLFRLLYGGSAYAYANDSSFASVSGRVSFWQNVIDETYTKYRGLAKWHEDLIREVSTTGKLRVPTGREYVYSRVKNYKGELEWPRTTILNYPVQGYAADLVQIARVSAWRRLRDKAVFFNTVHDDIELDVVNNPELCYNISIELEKVFEDVPSNMKRIYGYDMKVPMSGEVSFGHNLKDMIEFDRTKGKEQFECFLRQ